jgi:hypothetical protein
LASRIRSKEKMTVYEIPNIEHCTVRPLGNPVIMYRITANEGWYIHLNDGDEETANHWTGEVGLLATTDFSIVEIRAEADLPEGAEINGETEEPQPEVM